MPKCNTQQQRQQKPSIHPMGQRSLLLMPALYYYERPSPSPSSLIGCLTLPSLYLHACLHKKPRMQLHIYTLACMHCIVTVHPPTLLTLRFCYSHIIQLFPVIFAFLFFFWAIAGVGLGWTGLDWTAINRLGAGALVWRKKKCKYDMI